MVIECKAIEKKRGIGRVNKEWEEESNCGRHC
jgi:hypothetical protein